MLRHWFHDLPICHPSFGIYDEHLCWLNLSFPFDSKNVKQMRFAVEYDAVVRAAE